jgi:hypothetical protein
MVNRSWATRAVLLGHLIVPAAALLDIGTSPSITWAAKSVFGVAIASTVWLIAGVLSYIYSQRSRAIARRALGPVLATYAIVFAVGLMELFLRVAAPGASRQSFLFTPGILAVQDHDPRITPGITGKSTVTINRLGLRGTEPPQSGSPYRIITIGGSTTICTDLDDRETWQFLAQRQLNERLGDGYVWIGNAGVDGHTAVHHLSLLQRFPVTRDADALVFLTGVNDLGAALAANGAETKKLLSEDAELYFDNWTGANQFAGRPFFRRIRVVQLLRTAYSTLAERALASRRQTGDQFYIDMRRHRRSAPVVPPPSLDTGLREYADRISRIASECRSTGIRCIFLTQPTMWKAEMDSRDQNLLWGAWVGDFSNPRGYLSPKAAAAAMKRYNDVLMQTCQTERVECWDLAAVVPKDSSAFVDDEHFNEHGAAIVARFLTDMLLKTPPLNQPRTETFRRSR